MQIAKLKLKPTKYTKLLIMFPLYQLRKHLILPTLWID